MERIAVFPGSFDPFTIGHESIVRRALPLFDRIIIAIGENSTKVDFFPLEKRLQWIKELFEYDEKISVCSFKGLTVDFCRQQQAQYIIRGLRTSADFEYERAIAQVNRFMNDKIETIFILTLPEHTAITSTLVREIIRHGGDARKFLPKGKNSQNWKIH